MLGGPLTTPFRRAVIIGGTSLLILGMACSTTTTTNDAGKVGSTTTAGTAGDTGVTTGTGVYAAKKGSGYNTIVDATAAAANPLREDRTPASAWATNDPAVQHLKFKVGPITIKSGQNSIAFTGADIPKPAVDGYIVGFGPDLKFENGMTPGVDDVHLHHAVWLNLGAKDPTVPRLPERFFAAGEEKTNFRAPAGYGYPYKATDTWLLNYMIHNLWPDTKQVWVTYDVDFVPADSPAASSLKGIRPLWMDVENGKIYPVFDALKGQGNDGIATYPDDYPSAYAPPTTAPPTTTTTAAGAPDATDRRRRPGGPGGGGGTGGITTTNLWTADRDLTIVNTAAHLHPGGLYSDMRLQRSGASAAPGSPAAAVAEGDTVRLFRSEAVYYEPQGAVSWDLSMTGTPPDWRVAVKKGDVLSINVTYDVRKASWYESMGIQVAWYTDGLEGVDPFQQRVDALGLVSHGHLPENDNHGGDTKSGGRDAMLPDPTRITTFAPTTQVDIRDYVYLPGDMANSETIPEVKAGGALKFLSFDGPLENGIWHTITSCKSPCNLSTGIAYPLADGDVQFDSGQLGQAGEPTANRNDWTIPSTIAPGFYSYFCRVHPFMRGSFKVTP